MSRDSDRRVVYDGPIIDAHCHPQLEGEVRIGRKPHRPDDYLRRVSGLDVRFIAALVMAPQGDLLKTRSLNNKILALGRRSRGRFFPVCSVHPADGADARTEVDRVSERGARALKLHPNTQQFDVSDRGVKEVVSRAAVRHLPVLFDAYSPFDADRPGKFIRLAMEVPDARIILAHGHGPRFPDLIVYDILARYPWWRRNVWIDLSVTANLLAPGPFAEQFAWVCRRVGVDRLIFGSDYPLDDPKEAVGALRLLGFSESELSAILYDNAARLFGFPPLYP